MSSTSPYVLKYSNNIIEHLGLKLYQNKPTNVLAELVSNSWDADAENVWIDINENYVAVSDDGIGMTGDDLQNKYLVIGKKKREASNLAIPTAKHRPVMGRKGIGKLAPFGIATKVTVFTVSSTSKECFWIEIDLEHLLASASSSETLSAYEPEVIYDGVNLSSIDLNNDPTGSINNFVKRISNCGGTLILMTNLSIKRSIPLEQLKKSIGQRFTVTLLRDDFKVHLNNEHLNQNVLPNFYFRIPSECPYQTEIININGIDRELKYWVGFLESADWSQDESGVGVYVHGKIAQDRPFVFGVKGHEITTRYMYGVIEADWLDELEEDVVSTDRTSIDWDNDDASLVYKKGAELVLSWIKEYREFQKNTNEEKILTKLKTLPHIPKVTNQEREVIKNMVCDMSPKIYKDEELQNEVLLQLTSAWTHKPTRTVIKTLWDQIEKSEEDEGKFLVLLDDIYKHLVPESLSLSVTFAQRIYALKKLSELTLNGNETQLQTLIEHFPWILGAENGKMIANQELKTLAASSIMKGLFPSHGHTAEELKNLPDAKKRPDFVILSDAERHVIKIIELKNPQINLQYAHLTQLFTYFCWIKENYPSADVQGYLIGKNPGDAIKSQEIKIKNWTQICLESRKDYVTLLAAMLSGASEYSDDSRVLSVFEFGGDETEELLKRIAVSNSDLKDFFQDMDRRLKI